MNNYIENKLSTLKTVKKVLKNEFVGINNIIDDIIDSIEPWYIFSENQVRPTIINLWGMTGVGKTSLIKRLFELLEINNIFKFDIGEFVSNTNNNVDIKERISNQLMNSTKTNPIFIFDEFQYGKTIDSYQNAIDRPSLRVIWDLFDTGKIESVEYEWKAEQLKTLNFKLTYASKNGVKVQQNLVIQNNQFFHKIMDYTNDETNNSNNENSIIHESINEFIPKGYISDIFELITKYKILDISTEFELIEYIKKIPDEISLINFIQNIIDNSIKTVTYDYSNSIIFIIGNLNNIYIHSDDPNPDIDANLLYKYTKKITLTDIKEALLELYSPEQISRLGNNHIIYTSLNSKHYKKIIKNELDKFVKKINDKWKININFSQNIHDLIYNEGVFPTQGVRPIFSTISLLIESYIGRIFLDINRNNKNITNININWDYINNKYMISCNDKIFYYDVKLKISQLRESNNDDKQCITAIHEAGHIITSIYFLKLCPNYAMSKTADNKSYGFTMIEEPDYKTFKYILNDIIVNYGGYVAEKIIFGKNNITTGSLNDLENITVAVNYLVKNFGFKLKQPIIIEHEQCNNISGYNTNAISLNNDKINKKVKNIVKNCFKKCEKLLNDNEKLLLKIGEYLTYNSTINKKDIKRLVKKHANFKPKYKSRKKYYDYKSNIKNFLK
jgi:cell division protease FtsH